MKKYSIYIYVSALVYFASVSIAFSYFRDDPLIFYLEVLVNAVFIAGCLIYAKKIKVRVWGGVFILAAAGEVKLLVFSDITDLEQTALWVLILGPSIYFNYKVMTGYK